MEEELRCKQGAEGGGDPRTWVVALVTVAGGNAGRRSHRDVGAGKFARSGWWLACTWDAML